MASHVPTRRQAFRRDWRIKSDAGGGPPHEDAQEIRLNGAQ